MSGSSPPFTTRRPWAELRLRDEDRSAIEGLDTLEAQSWIWQRIEEYDYRIRTLRFAYNASSPINRILPEEVLSEIFSLLPWSTPDKSDDPHTAYLLVCRGWYSLLLRTPRFWSALVSQPRILTNKGWQSGVYDRYLERSGSIPLALSVDDPRDETFRSLNAQSYRITSLRVNILVSTERGLRLLNSLLNAGMPSLVELDFSHMHDFGYCPGTPELELRAQQLPRLQSLTHSWMTVKVGDAVAALRHMRLEGCECDRLMDSAFDLTSLLATVTQSPRLESLLLSQENMWYNENRAPVRGADAAPVVSPNLVRLDIRDCHTTIISTILSKVICPPTCHISLTAPSLHKSLPAEPFTPIALADYITLDFRYKEKEHAALTTYINGTKALSFVYKSEMDLAGRRRAFQTCMSDLGKALSGANVITALTIRGVDCRTLPGSAYDGYVGGPGDFRKLLTTLPALTRLDFLGWDGRQWLVALLAKSIHPNGEERLCPRMRELAVSWYPKVDKNVLLEDVSRRARPKERVGGQDPGHVRLGHVVFDDFCDRMSQMLQSRAEHGSPLERLSVLVDREITGWYVDDEGWEPEMLRERMWKRFEGLIEKLEVSYASD